MGAEKAPGWIYEIAIERIFAFILIPTKFPDLQQTPIWIQDFLLVHDIQKNRLLEYVVKASSTRIF